MPWTARPVRYEQGIGGTARAVAAELNRVDAAGGRVGPVLHAPGLGFIVTARYRRMPFACQEDLGTTLLPPVGGGVDPWDFEPDEAGLPAA